MHNSRMLSQWHQYQVKPSRAAFPIRQPARSLEKDHTTYGQFSEYRSQELGILHKNGLQSRCLANWRYHYGLSTSSQRLHESVGDLGDLGMIPANVHIAREVHPHPVDFEQLR